MTVKIFLAGLGGQGVLSMGRILARALLARGKQVTYLPAHGGQVRGGMVGCTVAAASDEIASPVASTPNLMVLMTPPASLAHLPVLARGGLMLVNSEERVPAPPGREARVVCLPAASLARQAGHKRAANLAMLGALAEVSGLVSLEDLVAALPPAGLSGGEEMLAINRRAAGLGAAAGGKYFSRQGV